jgi:hypothetical protein
MEVLHGCALQMGECRASPCMKPHSCICSKSAGVDPRLVCTHNKTIGAGQHLQKVPKLSWASAMVKNTGQHARTAHSL